MNHGLTPQLMEAVPAAVLRVRVPGENLAEVLSHLRETYCSTIAYEIPVRDTDQRGHVLARCRANQRGTVANPEGAVFGVDEDEIKPASSGRFYNVGICPSGDDAVRDFAVVQPALQPIIFHRPSSGRFKLSQHVISAAADVLDDQSFGRVGVSRLRCLQDSAMLLNSRSLLSCSSETSICQPANIDTDQIMHAPKPGVAGAIEDKTMKLLIVHDRLFDGDAPPSAKLFFGLGLEQLKRPQHARIMALSDLPDG